MKFVWFKLVMILLFCLVSTQLLASRQATDLMSEALKMRSAGNLSQAANLLEQAIASADRPLQKKLARFMLGDTQLELRQYKAAIKTYNRLIDTLSDKEEIAEAKFRIMQSESALGNKSRVQNLFGQLRREHGKSPYYELAQAFMKVEGMKLPEMTSPAERKPAAKVVAKASSATAAPQKTPAPAPKPKSVPKSAPATPRSAADSTKTRTSVATQDSRPGAGLKKVDAQTAGLLKQILTVKVLEGQAQQDLVTSILRLQDQLKDGKDKPGMDKVMMELAENTVLFGELLEACRTYDEILALHPSSSVVEKAYFEAIRLRAVLGVHEAVVPWAKAFLAAFPTSEYKTAVRAFIEYSEAKGAIDFSNAEASPAGAIAALATDSSGEVENAKLKADKIYVQATRKMREGKYNMALLDFQRLSQTYPDAPQIWWDIALLYVQAEDFKKAEVAVRQKLRFDPQNEEANSLLGYILYRLEDYDEAASAYEQTGASEGRGITFFDGKSAAERMKKTGASR